MSSTRCLSPADAALLLSLVVGATSPAAAADPRQRALIVDLSTPGDSSTAAFISVDAEELSCSSGVPPATLQERLDKACGDDQIDVGGALEAARCLLPKSSLRWVSRRRDVLHVYVFYPDDRVRPRIAYHEEDRQSRIAADLATLLKVGLALKGGLAPGQEPGVACRRGTYSLERTRANLTVTVTQAASARETGTDAGAADGMSDQHKAEVTLTTGPVEHWFLTADVPARRMNELAFDAVSNALKPAQTPASFYIGVDYMIGDLLHDENQSSLLGNVVLKAMVKASKNPTESFGVGVGLRGHYLVNLDVVSPFAAVMYTRIDADVAAAVAATPHDDLARTYQFGISLNLDQALAWLKGEK